MAIIIAQEPREVSGNIKPQMSLEEFKLWLKQFDVDRNGKISKKELQQAIKATKGGWFTSLKSARGVAKADSNGNHEIDEEETRYLIVFAEKHLGIKISSYAFSVLCDVFVDSWAFKNLGTSPSADVVNSAIRHYKCHGLISNFLLVEGGWDGLAATLNLLNDDVGQHFKSRGKHSADRPRGVAQKNNLIVQAQGRD
ncbi:EF-hand domain [Dillenia turbinata]|uniref:EF-hand domain n=1 Tax=Dillenia turbinata TaxID=194707 RepID=A0AAN8Z756_9MAGN